MEDEIINVNGYNPIYKKTHIQIATFFGGPLAIVYILAENFRQLGYPEKIRKTWIIGIGLCLIFIGLTYFTSRSGKVPNFIIPVICILIGTAIMQSWQGEDIEQHVKEGGPVYPVWRALLVGIISLVITIVFMIILFLLLFNIFNFSLQD